MARDARIAFDVAEHERRGGGQPGRMRFAEDTKPLGRAQLVGADLVAHRVVEHLGRGPREGAETLRLQDL